jgi:hypothetical protein
MSLEICCFIGGDDVFVALDPILKGWPFENAV